MRGRISLFGILLAVVVFALLMVTTSTLLSTFSVSLTSEANTLISTLRSEENRIMTAGKDIQMGLEKIQFDPASFILGGYQIASATVNLLQTSTSSVDTVMTSVANYLGVPDWVVTSLSVMFTLVVVFTILNWLRGGGGL